MDISRSNAPYQANGAKYFGHADLNHHLASGKSVAELQQWARNNLDKMPGGNGANSKVYQDLMAMNSGGGGGGGYTPPSGGGGTVGREGFRKAYGEEFKENYDKALTAYDQDESKMGQFDGTSHDFRRGVKQEQAIKDNDPFNDSWDSRDFFSKHLIMGREAQKGRGDGTSIANKYIFNAQQTNPINIQALDQQIRTNPLYSEAKAELAGLDTFGDRYKNKGKTQSWMNPQAPSVYEPPDLQGISSDYMDRIDDIKL